MSGRCLEGVTRVSGRSQEDGWRVDGGCLEGVWNKNPHLISIGRKGPMCLGGAFKVSLRCLDGVGNLSENCLKGV